MIKTFANKETEKLFCEGVCAKIPTDIQRRALRKLDMLDAATTIDDLRVPPGNRLHRLRGKRVNQYAIRINDQWRICFRFEEVHAYDVELCDYHS